MREIIELIRIDFDAMENRNPTHITSIGMFEGDGNLTAHGKAKEWLSKQPPVKMFLGYDGNVYPQIITKRHFLQ